MNQISAVIQMADVDLHFVMDENNVITWRSTDRFTRIHSAGEVEPDKAHLFWQAVHIALSGEDDVENYNEIEEVLDFVGCTDSTRWIP